MLKVQKQTYINQILVYTCQTKTQRKIQNKLLFLSGYTSQNNIILLIINKKLYKASMWKKIAFDLASAAFLMIALLTLMEEVFAHMAFRVVLAFYSLLMTAVELSSFSSITQESLLQKVSYVSSVLGYLTFMQAVYLYDSFNKGNIYIIGSFFISVSALLKLLNILMKKAISSRKIWKNSYGFMRICCLGGVGLFFFITSIAQGLRDTSSYQTLLVIAKTSNIIAAGLHIFALYNMHKEEDLKQIDKVRFETSTGELNLA